MNFFQNIAFDENHARFLKLGLQIKEKLPDLDDH